MSKDNNSNKKTTKADAKSNDQVLSAEEKKQLVEKIKASLFLEDQESVQLYASLIKNAIP